MSINSSEVALLIQKTVYLQILRAVLELVSNNAKIVLEEQEEKKRYVKYQHNKYTFEAEYLNHNIKIECQNILLSYLEL
ncbi:hypothetical protein SAMN05444392_11611 [Seinonella peptonophila]|uniref:Uncharacterized protein n=1 Tax=Seinonella peptonophila TaxID=112248 RepID=A0A1M5AUH5_9BACL|nr:hypothetical protein [Seinonella peptonophila]SHF33899.1 hypothetical protein SAMN05444392_11611 [Seinonella peptonophila]